jgi:hypothetical protein
MLVRAVRPAGSTTYRPIDQSGLASLPGEEMALAISIRNGTSAYRFCDTDDHGSDKSPFRHIRQDGCAGHTAARCIGGHKTRMPVHAAGVHAAGGHTVGVSETGARATGVRA